MIALVLSKGERGTGKGEKLERVEKIQKIIIT
jgi:hypothetical protein